jgi:serine protease Do
MTADRWHRITSTVWGMALMASLVVGALSVPGSVQAAELSPEARRDLELRPGVVLIFIPLRGSIPELGVSCPDGKGVLGSGFIFRPDGYVITNGHVAQLANVKDADAKLERRKHILACLVETLTARLSAQRQQQGQPPLTARDLQNNYIKVQEFLAQGKITLDEDPATVKVCLDNQQCVNGEIKAYSDPFIEAANPGKDVAIIKVDGHDLPTVPFGNSDALRVNDSIEVIGYPGDAIVSSISTFVATSTEGTISAVKRLDHPDIPILQTSAVINPGNSGGPAFDGQGRVIGIATFKSGESYNYLVPLSVALEFVHQAGVEPQRGAFDSLWANALQAYSDGNWPQAHKLLQDVLEMMPHQPEAERLEREAATNERTEGGFAKLSHSVGGIGGFVGVALVVAVGCGLMAWLVMRNNVRKPVLVTPGGDSSGGDPSASKGPASARTRIIESTPTAPLPGQNFGTLHISGGPLVGNRFPVPKDGLVIGRDPARCAIVVPEDAVSGEHAWVVPLDNGVVVIDRNSSNGTYINSPTSARVNKVLLRHGDRVYLGTSTTTVLTYYSA